MSAQPNKNWTILLARIDGNISRTEGRLAELKAQKEAVERMINSPELPLPTPNKK